MKKVIEGHVYDTDKATKLGTWDNGQRGFDWCSETLYRTKSGMCFLHGDGGARSRYSKWENGSLYGDERIVPLSVKDAEKWAEEHLDGDEYIAAFGEPDEDAVHVMSMSVDEACYSKLKAMSTERGESMSAIVRSLVMGA